MPALVPDAVWLECFEGFHELRDIRHPVLPEARGDHPLERLARDIVVQFVLICRSLPRRVKHDLLRPAESRASRKNLKGKYCFFSINKSDWSFYHPFGGMSRIERQNRVPAKFHK